MDIIPSNSVSQQGLFYIKITFFTHYARSFPNSIGNFSIILHVFYIRHGMRRLTRPVLPWLRAPYPPKRGTHHCRCIPPHGCPHNAIQNLSWCFPPVCRFVFRGSPVSVLSHSSSPINRIFRLFCWIFAQKKKPAHGRLPVISLLQSPTATVPSRGSLLMMPESFPSRKSLPLEKDSPRAGEKCHHR